MSAGRTISSAPAGREPRRIERAEIDQLGGAVRDELGHRQAGRRRVENAPRPMAGRDERAAHAGHPADQRNAVVGDRTVAGLPAHDPRARPAPLDTRPAARASVSQELSFTSTASGESGSGAGSAIPHT